MNKLWIIGAGGHARVVAETASLLKYQPVFLRTEQEELLDGAESMTEREFFTQFPPSSSKLRLICGLGSVASLKKRAELIRHYAPYQASFINLVHPSAIVSKEAELGVGIFISAGAVISRKVRIGDHCIINTGSIIDHDSVLGANCHIATGATLAGSVQCAENVHVGCGSVLIQGLSIASGSIIGAGTICIHKIEETDRTWVGNPARILDGAKPKSEFLGRSKTEV